MFGAFFIIFITSKQMPFDLKILFESNNQRSEHIFALEDRHRNVLHPSK